MIEKLTTEKFIEKAKLKHNDKYDYSKAKYTTNKDKVLIICKEHGDFEQQAGKHMNRGDGCPKCAQKARNTKNSSTTEEFIEKAEAIHNKIYDYSKVDYKNKNTKVEIICSKHGSFYIRPGNHIHVKPQGCHMCGIENTTKRITLTKDIFLEQATRVHGNKYDYSNVEYVNTNTKVRIICRKHGLFEQRPINHIHQKSGCPNCTEAYGGFKPAKPAILYYLSINDGQAYKIGITNRSINERFSIKELKSIKVIKIWEYQAGYDAFKEEQRILSEFSYAKYTGEALLDIGNTELFNKDILLLDNN